MGDFPAGRSDRLAVVLMATAPIAGRSGVRLCPPLTPEQAADLQAAFLRDTIGKVAALRDVERIIFCLEEPQDLHSILPPEFTIVSQRSSGLGAGLQEAIERASAAGFGQVLVLVSDSPTLPLECIEEGIAQLEEHDMVLGPCADGGYYALGLHRPLPQLFDGISWGTEWVLAQTLTAARNQALRWKLLPIWYDIDTEEELDRLAQELAENPNLAPETSACLRRIGLMTSSSHTPGT